MEGIIVIFCYQDTKLSSHMDQINEHINSSNHKIYSYDQIGGMIVNLVNNKCENNNNSACQIISLENELLLNIV